MPITIAADRRRIEVEPDEQAHALVLGVAPRLVAVRVEAARAMWAVETTRTYVAHRCASIEEYGVRFLGVSAREARDLVDLGRALAAAPTAAVVRAVESARTADAVSSTGDGEPGGDAATVGVAKAGAASDGAGAATPDAAGAAGAGVPAPVTVADAVLTGALSVERAVAAGQFLRKPDLLRAGEDAVALALTGSMRQVRSILRDREEEQAQREPVVPLPLSVTVRARDDFRRARSLASERAGAMLTEGQTFALVVHHWLGDFDPLRRREGARRVPDTAKTPGCRYVPQSVRRAVIRRSGGMCEVPGCTRRTFLTLAHDRAHAAGGSREEENLWNACRPHHLQFDAGLIRICGWRDGHPLFCDDAGRLLEDRARIACRAATAAGEAAAAGAPLPPESGAPRSAEDGADDPAGDDAGHSTADSATDDGEHGTEAGAEDRADDCAIVSPHNAWIADPVTDASPSEPGHHERSARRASPSNCSGLRASTLSGAPRSAGDRLDPRSTARPQGAGLRQRPPPSSPRGRS